MLEHLKFPIVRHCDELRANSEALEPEQAFFSNLLVSWNQSSQHNSHVIPGKLAIASATRNPEISKISGFPFARE
jgi:hypothetical protein